MASGEGVRLIEAGVIYDTGDRLVVTRPLLTDAVHRAVLGLAEPIPESGASWSKYQVPSTKYPENMLEDRRSEVLRALVEEHIRTGEPVSSRSIAEHSRLAVSPATIRHDLAALEQEGYVVQPHTSAGRMPTAAAYRYYVDHSSPGRLRQPAQERINSFFGEVHLELSKLLRATSDLLAEITDLPSVVVAPGVGRERVRALHTVQVTTDQILLIVITEGGRVVQQRGRVRVPVTPQEIEQGQRLMSAAVVGSELGRAAPPD